MKTIRHLKIWTIILLSAGTVGFAQTPIKKEVHEKFSAAQIDKLILESKFGDATIKDNGSDQITLDVWISTDEKNFKERDYQNC